VIEKLHSCDRGLPVAGQRVLNAVPQTVTSASLLTSNCFFLAISYKIQHFVVYITSNDYLKHAVDIVTVLSTVLLQFTNNCT